MMSPFLLAQALYMHVFSVRQEDHNLVFGYPIQKLLEAYPKEKVTEALWILEMDLQQRGFELVVYEENGIEYLTTRQKWSISDKIHFDDAVLLGIISLESLDESKIEKHGYNIQAYQEFKRKDIEEFCYLHDLPIKTRVSVNLEFLERQGYIVQTKKNPLTYKLGKRFFIEYPENVRQELHVLLLSALKSLHSKEKQEMT